MRLAADTNVLLSAIAGKAAVRVFTSPGINIITCPQVLDEVAKYIPVFAEKYSLSPELLHSQFRLLAVQVCPVREFQGFLTIATTRLKNRDLYDVDLLALALAKRVSIWTNDRDFEGCGVECL